MKKKQRKNFVLISLIIIILLVISFFVYNKIDYQTDIENLDLFGIDDLIIVSHPSDELVYSTKQILNGKNLVVCISCSKEKPDTKSFIRIMKKTKNEYITFDYKEYKNSNRLNWDKNKLTKDLEKIIDTKNWNSIITHNSEGEYGNIHHILVSDIVTNLVKDKDKLYYFADYYYINKNSKTYDYLPQLDEEILKEKYKLLNRYPNKKEIIETYYDILPYEEYIPYRKWIIK